MNCYKVGDIVDVDAGQDGRFERYWTGEVIQAGLVIVVRIDGAFQVTAQRQHVRLRERKQ